VILMILKENVQVLDWQESSKKVKIGDFHSMEGGGAGITEKFFKFLCIFLLFPSIREGGLEVQTLQNHPRLRPCELAT